MVKEAIVGEGPDDEADDGARARKRQPDSETEQSHSDCALTDEIKIETRETRKAAQKAAKKKASRRKAEGERRAKGDEGEDGRSQAAQKRKK